VSAAWRARGAPGEAGEGRYSDAMPEKDGSRAATRRPRRLTYLLAALSRAMRREMRDGLEEIGVDARDWTTLAFLAERPYSSNAELSRRIGVTPQAVHTVILRLERRQLIERHPDPNHGRIARFTLTRYGRATLDRCDAVADEVEKRALTDLGAVRRRALVSDVVTALRRLEHPDADAAATDARRRQAAQPGSSPDAER